MAPSFNLPRILSIFIITLLTLCRVPALNAQSTVDARSKTLARILAEYHEALLERDPLTAPATHPDQLPDLSVAAENAWHERQQTFIQRLSEVDLTGLPEQARRPAETLLNTLIEDQSFKHGRQWQMPLDQFNRLHAGLVALAQTSTISTSKDYDDYLARLKKLPAAFSQVMTNLQLSRDQGRFPLDDQLDRAQQIIQAVAAVTAETSPFAEPLKRFPATIPAETRKRIATEILATISTDVLPAYARVGRFVAAMPVPAMTNGRVHTLNPSHRSRRTGPV